MAQIPFPAGNDVVTLFPFASCLLTRVIRCNLFDKLTGTISHNPHHHNNLVD